ncbi:MAG TPA: hypothetical protein VFA23_06185 [Dongiaceae bacterium]|nr:hypothetical protein [Dongiaceae bacterium]
MDISPSDLAVIRHRLLEAEARIELAIIEARLQIRRVERLLSRIDAARAQAHRRRRFLRYRGGGGHFTSQTVIAVSLAAAWQDPRHEAARRMAGAG